MSVRPLRRGDVEAVLALWDALLHNGEAADPRFCPAEGRLAVFRSWIEEEWTRREPFPHGWVVERDGAVVGFLSCAPVRQLPVLDQPLTWVIGDLFVAPGSRGRGLGAALVQAAAEAASRAGFPQARVGTLTADGAAVSFWKKQGFEDYMVTLLRGPQASGR